MKKLLGILLLLPMSILGIIGIGVFLLFPFDKFEFDNLAVRMGANFLFWVILLSIMSLIAYITIKGLALLKIKGF